MKKEHIISLVVVVIGLAVALYVLLLPVAPFSKNNPNGVSVAGAPTRPAPGAGATTTPIAVVEAAAHNNTALLPHASETYQIMQSASTTPKIVQATIDPLGVHVGDTQHLSIVLQDANPIVSAEALIQTDHGTTTLQLALVGPTQVSELLPQKYYVDAQNHLALVNSANTVAAGAAGGSAGAQAGQGVALAATGGDVTYAGSWLVHDTHNTTYTTTFVVKDAAGNTNSVVLAWSDACGIPNNGSWTSSVPCSTGSGSTFTDGVENGDATFSAGTFTLNTTFVVNPGYNIIFSGGTIAIGQGAGGQILSNQYLCALDADGDGYWGGSVAADANSNCSASHSGWTRRYLLTGSGDCDDTNVNVHPGVTAFATTSDPTMSAGYSPWDYNCDGAVTEEYTSTVTSCTPTGSGTCNGTACGSAGSCSATTGSVTTACGGTFSMGSCNPELGITPSYYCDGGNIKCYSMSCSISSAPTIQGCQ